MYYKEIDSSSAQWRFCVFVALIAIISLVLSSVALTKQNSRVPSAQLSDTIKDAVLIHATTENDGSEPVATLYVGNMLGSVATQYGSTDSSGLVRASQDIPNTYFIVNVKFGKAFKNLPRSVIVTASGTAELSSPLSADIVGHGSFQVIGVTSSHAVPGAVKPLFYYQVL